MTCTRDKRSCVKDSMLYKRDKKKGGHAYDIVCRAHEIVSNAFEVMSRTQDKTKLYVLNLLLCSWCISQIFILFSSFRENNEY